MTANIVEQFARYLLNKKTVAGDLVSKFDAPSGRGGDAKLRDLWELSELSANDFADDSADFDDSSDSDFDSGSSDDSGF